MLAITDFENAVVVWSIRGALICMVLFFGIRLSRDKSYQFGFDIAKSVWLIGSLLALLHALATMAFHHQFQHQLALVDTARQTEATIGIAVGIGIYFNYAFVLIWLVDAFWLCGFSPSYLSRPRFFDLVTYGFLAFIAFNGAVVFETGPLRWLSIAAILALILMHFHKRYSKIPDDG